MVERWFKPSIKFDHLLKFLSSIHISMKTLVLEIRLWRKENKKECRREKKKEEGKYKGILISYRLKQMWQEMEEGGESIDGD